MVATPYALNSLPWGNVGLGSVTLGLELDMNYGGQHHTVRLKSPRLLLEGPEDVTAVCDAFNEVFAAAYGAGSIHPYGGILVQLFRLVAGAAGLRLEARPRPVAAATADGVPHGDAVRDVCWPGFGPLAAPVHDLAVLPDGFATEGPALMEDVDTVVAVSPGWTYALDDQRAGWLTAGDLLELPPDLPHIWGLSTGSSGVREARP